MLDSFLEVNVLQVASAPRRSDRCECSTTQLTDMRSHRSDFDLKQSKNFRFCPRGVTESVPVVRKSATKSSSSESNCSEVDCNEQ